MSLRPSSSLQSYKKQYRIGSSLASTKADLRQSELHIGANKSAAKALERGGSAAKLAFYRGLERANSHYRSDLQLAGQEAARPASQHSQNWRPSQPKTSKTAEELLFNDSGLGSKPRNVNLPSHFKRALGTVSKKAARRPATSQPSASDAHSASRFALASKKVTEAKSDSDFLTVKSKADERLLSQDLEPVPQKPQDLANASSSDFEVLRERFERNPKGCLEDQLYELDRYSKLLGAANETQAKERQKLIDEQLRLTNTGRFEGEYRDFEPILPGEQFSLYMQDEPDFNREGHKQPFQRAPVLKVQPKDEQEIQSLMAEAYERYAFYLKHTDVQYDHEFKALKGSQVRLTRIEMDKLRREYKLKADG